MQERIKHRGNGTTNARKRQDRDIGLARLIQNAADSKHAYATGHKPLWKENKFIDSDNHWYTRKVKEAIHIRLHANSINMNNGIEIPEAWMPIIKKHQKKHAASQRTPEENIAERNNSRIKPHQSEADDTDR